MAFPLILVLSLLFLPSATFVYRSIVGVVGGYIHGGDGDAKAGRLGALVALSSSSPNRAALAHLASQLALHVVGLNPRCVDADTRSLVAEATARGVSPQALVEDVVLLEQRYFLGGGETVREMLTSEGARLGAPVTVHAFVRLAVGEGMERQQADFAKEVMDMIKV